MNHAQFWGGGGAASYEIEQSLRFDGSSKLSRTPSSAGTTTTWTLSYWIKIGSLTAEQAILSAPAPGGGYTATWYSAGATSRVKINQYNHPTNVYSKCPTPVYRDPSAWFHVVVVYDSTNATADDRVRFYVNGVRLTDFSDDGSSVGGTTNPSQNQTSGINNNSIQYIGSQFDGTYAFTNSYLAEMHLLDGTAVTNAEDFGELDDNGVWRPIEVSGVTYGTNGWYMKFDPSATNGIGHDHSGNSNNFSPTGFVTSGTGTDVMSDTPTTNWCTLNPLKKGANVDLSDGNLVATMTSTNVRWNGTIAMPPGSGKYYAEMTVTQTNNYGSIGLSSIDDPASGETSGYAGFNGNYKSSAYGSSYGTGDVIGIAYDAVNGAVYFSKNGTWQNSGDPTSGSSATGAAESGLTGTYVFGGGIYGGTTGIYTLNFGQRDFAYTPPTGYSGLNTANLPAPDIKDGSDYFTTLAYSGTSTTDSKVIKDSQDNDWAPDFVWLKKRNSGANHMLYDRVRGASKSLRTNVTNAEVTGATNGDLTAFTSSGFTLDSGNDVNASGNTYVAWNWLAANGTSSIAAGSIDGTNPTIASTVSVNQTAGFSIVSYTGASQGSDNTVGHGLGVPPKFVIIKNRDAGQNWQIGHDAIGTDRLLFNTNAVSSSGGFSAVPTSTVVNLLGGVNRTNINGDDFIMYCFAEVEGYSKFGSYVGNGNADGPFVWCGFRPAWVLIKNSNSATDWHLFDTARDPSNEVTQALYPDTSGSEDTLTNNEIDILSNGFKPRSAGGSTNGSGNTLVFAAFAENPFGGSGVSPATAR